MPPASDHGQALSGQKQTGTDPPPGRQDQAQPKAAAKKSARRNRAGYRGRVPKEKKVDLWPGAVKSALPQAGKGQSKANPTAPMVQQAKGRGKGKKTKGSGKSKPSQGASNFGAVPPPQPMPRQVLLTPGTRAQAAAGASAGGRIDTLKAYTPPPQPPWHQQSTSGGFLRQKGYR